MQRCCCAVANEDDKTGLNDAKVYCLWFNKFHWSADFRIKIRSTLRRWCSGDSSIAHFAFKLRCFSLSLSLSVAHSLSCTHTRTKLFSNSLLSVFHVSPIVDVKILSNLFIWLRTFVKRFQSEDYLLISPKLKAIIHLIHDSSHAIPLAYSHAIALTAFHFSSCCIYQIFKSVLIKTLFAFNFRNSLFLEDWWKWAVGWSRLLVNS